MRATHALCGEHNDVATASLLEVWIDEAERRTWFLFEQPDRPSDLNWVWRQGGRKPSIAKELFKMRPLCSPRWPRPPFARPHQLQARRKR